MKILQSGQILCVATPTPSTWLPVASVYGPSKFLSPVHGPLVLQYMAIITGLLTSTQEICELVNGHIEVENGHGHRWPYTEPLHIQVRKYSILLKLG